MLWAILSSVFAIAFGIAGTLYPDKRRLLWALGICSLISAITLIVYQSFNQPATSTQFLEISAKLDKVYENTQVKGFGTLHTIAGL